MLEVGESRIRKQVSSRDVAGSEVKDQDAGEWQECWWLGRGELECRLGSAMLEGGVRRSLIQVFGRDIGG